MKLTWTGTPRMSRLTVLLAVAVAVGRVAWSAEQASVDHEAAEKTVIVSAEGLADPNADTYKRDKGLLMDALREDAQRQVIEKAVGIYVDSSTLVENYTLVRDRVLTKSKGLIKRIIKESNPWLGKDGFMHILIKAEVYITKVGDALKAMSKTERVSLIRDYGNPKISVRIMARDADRASTTGEERSEIAENVLIEQLTKFGYRVWSENANPASGSQPTADFSIVGEAKFKKLSARLPPSNLLITKYVLTSLSIRCVNNHTGEIILSKNEVPRNKSWADEDAAVQDIGKLVGQEFTKEFFEDHLMERSKIYELKVTGLPNYDTGTELKKELIGLRPVLNVDFRDFSADGVSDYEVTFAGARGDFTELVNDTVVKPLNAKFGGDYFKLMSAHGEVVEVAFKCDTNPKAVLGRFETAVPASLAQASPERLKELVKDEATMKKVAEVNPSAVKKLAASGDNMAGAALKAVKNF